MKTADEFQILAKVLLLPSSIHQSLLQFLILELAARRVWMWAHWGRAPCRGSGKARGGGGGHGFFVHSAVWMQLEPFPAP